jgi:anti-sigma factor (TIGR02949 family)
MTEQETTHDDNSSLEHCEHVLARVYEFLDHELDDASGDAIRRHLVDCEPCLDRFDVEQALKSLVNRKCGGDKAPTQLRTRIVTQMTVIRRSL